MIEKVLAHYSSSGADFGYQGPFEECYNQAFAAFMGGGFADAVATGTAALYIALAALSLPKGSQVLVSPITDPGSLSAIILNGLTPRLMDSMPGGYNIGVEQFLERLSPEVSAVMVVHSIGQAVEIDRLVAEAHRRGIKVLEDCSQSHGARYEGRLVGTFGDIAAFSTMYRKASITGACGGVVYTRDENLYHLALAHADRGKPRWVEGFDDRDPRGFLFPALNLHTDEVSCAIGLTSLARLSETIAKRQAFVETVAQMIAACSRVCRPYAHSRDGSPFIYPLLMDASAIACSVQEFAEAVRAEGIGLNPCYRYVVREWPWLHPYLADDFVTANAFAIRDRSFNVYLNENYGPQEAEDVARAVEKVERHFSRS